MLCRALLLDTAERRARIRAHNAGSDGQRVLPEEVTGLIDLEDWEYDACLTAADKELYKHP